MTNEELRRLDVVALLTGLKAERTVQAYAQHWKRYLAFSTYGGPIADADTLIAFRQHLVQETKDSANTINLRLESVKGIFRELAERRMIPRETWWAINDVKSLKGNLLIERRSPNARVRIEPEEMRGIIEVPVVRLGDPVGARNRALLLVMATTGMRISEIIAIKVSDLQRSGKNYFVANIMGKGAAESRVAPLGTEAFEAIQSWLHVRPTKSEWVFTSITYDSTSGNVLYSTQHITRSAAYHIVKSIAKEYGMPHVKPHDFRRFVGTQLAKNDIRQAQLVLGHKNIGTTAKHYVLDEVPLGTTEGLF